MLADYKIPCHSFWSNSEVNPPPQVIPDFPNFLGELGGEPVFAESGPMECSNQVWVAMAKGVRWVTVDEWQKMKGVPKEWSLTKQESTSGL